MWCAVRSGSRSQPAQALRQAAHVERPPVSQPLCFNLFGELAENRELASRVLRRLSGGRVAAVTEIEFEHSPGRGDAKRFTGDRSAFDTTTADTRGFAGIEVKYHEDLDDSPSPHRERYDEIAAKM